MLGLRHKLIQGYIIEIQILLVLHSVHLGEENGSSQGAMKGRVRSLLRVGAVLNDRGLKRGNVEDLVQRFDVS